MTPARPPPVHPPPAAPPPAIHAPFLAAAGLRFCEAYDAVRAAITGAFPHAHPVAEHGMPGWRAPRPPDAPRPAQQGTIDPDYVYVGLAERKAGPTLHLWHPGAYDFLGQHSDALREAGFKVMVGCLPYTRAGPYPAQVVARLLEAAAAVDRPPGHATSKRK